ncbi:MAG TPA: ribose-phosphate pyrophosphokinase [Acidimicrobiales bacterium]|nr:ribose-phosphate pyrophosphokinase [Acidimicrobiales bacterium]
MTARILPGTANRPLAAAMAQALGTELTQCHVDRFPDGELRPVIAPVRGEDVYVVQPTSPPVNEHVVELLLLLDACRRAGADRVTAVIPYFGYARQDRRASSGEAVGARVVAGAIAGAGADRLVVVDPHTLALEPMCDIPVEMVTAVPVLAEALTGVSEDAVLVAPDLGATKLAQRYATLLGLPVAIVRKSRLSGQSVVVEELVGDVVGRPAVIVDDMVTTGGTVEAAVRALLEAKAADDVVVAATHGLFAGPAPERLGPLPIARVVVTDTVRVGGTAARPTDVRSVGPLLAETIRRLHADEPLNELLVHG